MLDLKVKKILVTGGDGFLGQHLVRALISRGVPKANIFVPHREEYDLRLIENCRQVLRGMDAVVHLAGVTGDGEFHRDHPAEIFYDNLLLGVELLEAAREVGVEKFVGIGSVTEYPQNAPLPYEEQNLWVGPVDGLHEAYTIAKKMLLVQGQAYRAQYGLNVIHVLLTNLYGPGKEAVRGFVVTNIIQRMLQAEADGSAYVEVWGTGQPTRDFLYVEDAAEGIVRALESYDQPEPVNLGSGWEISIRELTEIVAKILDFRGEIRFDPAKPEGVRRRMVNPTRAEKEFGFRPRTSFEDGLRKTIDWQRNQMARQSQ